MKTEGHAVEPTCAVLNTLGAQVAVKTWRKHAQGTLYRRRLQRRLLGVASSDRTYLTTAISILGYQGHHPVRGQQVRAL